MNGITHQEEHIEEPRHVDFPLGPGFTAQEAQSMTKMLTSFVDIFGTSAGALREPYATQFKHYITIPNNARPLWIRQRRLAPAETTYLKKYIQQLQAIDAIEPTTSPWNSQVILVKKKGAAAGDFRVTVNMKPLNRLLNTADLRGGGTARFVAARGGMA